MPDLRIQTAEGSEWLPADHVKGVPECIECNTPLLVIGSCEGVYAYCVTCYQYYLPHPKVQEEVLASHEPR